MKTDELITLLAAREGGVAPARPLARVSPALAAGLALALAGTLALFGANPDLAADASHASFWARPLFALALLAAVLPPLAACARPAARARLWPLTLPLAVLWLAAAQQLMSAPEGTRAALLLGDSWQACAASILLLALPSLALMLTVLRTMAPTRLALAGALAGLASGCLAALAYSVHCPELALPFAALWYVLGIVLCALSGAWLGPRVLAW
ncbi:NrsF family protein [Crenobacter intestini]|uniref:DUF1109 domain-containing protein n=1 Tax=Crenobacter intestini TaxID=2563443 RepID=A0A4T0V1B2_9NEIS|nr:DUF1109 domain-containing protein [Crenobacter intestini]TIC85342.1 DUF1109 domain-containing protein [Crenobacter intestini]